MHQLLAWIVFIVIGLVIGWLFSRGAARPGMAIVLLGISYQEFLSNGKNQLPPEFFQQTLSAIANLGLDCELIIAGCVQDDDGDPYAEIFRTDAWGNFSREENFSAIGSGAHVASAALFQREHDSSVTLMNALYNVFEAKRLGEISPGVGSSTTVDVLLSDGSVRAISDECFDSLEKLFRRYGPKRISKDLEFRPDFLEEEPIT